MLNYLHIPCFSIRFNHLDSLSYLSSCRRLHMCHVWSKTVCSPDIFLSKLVTSSNFSCMSHDKMTSYSVCIRGNQLSKCLKTTKDVLIIKIKKSQYIFVNQDVLHHLKANIWSSTAEHEMRSDSLLCLEDIECLKTYFLSLKTLTSSDGFRHDMYFSKT